MPRAVAAADRGDRRRHKSEPSDTLREKPGTGQRGGLARESNKQRGEPANNNANGRGASCRPMDATTMPRDCRDWDQNQRQAGSDHVQRKRHRQSLQHDKKLIR